MALPKLQAPTYELKLPSSGKKIKYRSFLVKEEKLLMIANETGEEEERILAISQIIENCTFSKLNARNMPVFDIEYLFLQLRAKSVGESAEVKVLCPDDGITYVDVTINLEDIKCSRPKKNANVIKLDDLVGVTLKYPSISTSNANDLVDVLSDSIESIFDGESVYDPKDFSKEDLKSFIESMTQGQLNKVIEFFDNIPRVHLDVEVTNPKTSEKSSVRLEGLDSFF